MQQFDAPLGGVSLEQFLRRYWQRRPLLVRQAIPGLASPVDAHELFELAGRDDVESRLVTSFGGRWRLQPGPIERVRLPLTRRKHWTLLVHGVDLHVDEAHALLQRFRFINDARLDDLMISYATDGGGVGPHLDSYDVFLLQAAGRRRWRVGRKSAGQPALRDDVPLKMIAEFESDEEWVLEPGDMLYLPPECAHEGAALGPCMTISIGFRSPSRVEYLRAWLGDRADSVDGADPRHADRGRTPVARPAQIPASLDRQLIRWARSWRPTQTDIRRFNGRFLTEPKPTVWFDAPARRLNLAQFSARARRHGLIVDRRTRIAYRGRDFFINGECLPGLAVSALCALADQRILDGAKLDNALQHEDVAQLLHQWWAHGWLRIPIAVQNGRM
jgi:50S ribosomal protein L16 3-hydroxylase